jgi:hypothetical protein
MKLDGYKMVLIYMLSKALSIKNCCDIRDAESTSKSQLSHKKDFATAD